MEFYDIVFQREIDEKKIENILKRAKFLGYKGVCLVFPAKKFKKKNEEKLKLITKNIKVFIGYEARSRRELELLIKNRKLMDFIVVRGGELNLNRIACEKNEVDLVYNLERERDSGFNHIMARLARKNDVIIGFNLKTLIHENDDMLKKTIMNLKIAKKYKNKVFMFSGATDEWELKDPKILIAMLVVFGYEMENAKETFTNLKRKLKKRKNNWIMPGVKVIK